MLTEEIPVIFEEMTLNDGAATFAKTAAPDEMESLYILPYERQPPFVDNSVGNPPCLVHISLPNDPQSCGSSANIEKSMAETVHNL